MKRGNFLKLAAASPLGFMVPKDGERNVLQLTAGEFAARLKPMRHTEDARATGLLQLAESMELDGGTVEMFENNRECGQCKRSTYRYRWLLRPEGFDYPDPEPWYCVCGFEVGAVWDDEIHSKPINWNKPVRLMHPGSV